MTWRDGHSRIFTVQPDGTGAKIRTGGWAPAWSPDGLQLAYIAPNQHITIRGGQGAVDTGVPSSGARIDWSPDGTMLAYEDQTWVWVMNVTPPYAPRQITSSPCGDWGPAWAPDSTQIAYNGACSSAIWVIDADGTNNHVLPNPLGLIEELSPDWSPDGSRIAFLSWASRSTTGVWLMNIDGTDQHLLTQTLAFYSTPDWSPDGTQIAFVGSQGGLARINADGSGLVSIPTPGTPEDPRWGTRPGAP